jgi:TM2 domain-containing membrane protein YozV
MALSEKHKQKIREEEEYREKVRKEVAPEFSGGKSKVAAALLAFFLGDFGIHKFYLGKTGQGIIYLTLSVLFCWTIVIPFVIAIICWIEGIVYLTMDDKEFAKKYK